MRILISPAKRMETDTDSLPWRDLPAFLPEAERLLARLRELTNGELRELWQIRKSGRPHPGPLFPPAPTGRSDR